MVMETAVAAWGFRKAREWGLLARRQPCRHEAVDGFGGGQEAVQVGRQGRALPSESQR